MEINEDIHSIFYHIVFIFPLQYNENTYSQYEATKARAEENLMWEAKLEEMMMTMNKSKRRLEGSYHGTM